MLWLIALIFYMKNNRWSFHFTILNQLYPFSELALYALDVYYNQTYGGDGLSSKVDSENSNSYDYFYNRCPHSTNHFYAIFYTELLFFVT